LRCSRGASPNNPKNWLAAELAYNRALYHRPHDAEARAALARLPKEKRPFLALLNHTPTIAGAPSSIAAAATPNGKLPEIKVHQNFPIS
jgi:hypothetical protein